MSRTAKTIYALSCLFLTGLSQPLTGQTAAADPTSTRAEAYYHFSMGHLYAELAAAFGNRGEYATKAIDHYKQALKHDPNSPILFEELTDMYIQSGKLRDAVLETEEMIRQNPSSVSPRRILGRIYMRMVGDAEQGKVDAGMLRKATEQFQKITELDPKDVDAWLTLGRLHRVARSSLEAEKAYKKAAELDPENEEALTGLAILYSDLGDTKRAIEMLSIVTTRNPNPRTLAALATSYEQMRDFASAADVLKKALELAPGNMRLKSGLAQNLLFSDRADEALKLYEEIVRDDARDLQAHLRIAEIHRQKRDFEKSRAALEKAKAIDKDSLEVRYDEVNLLEAEGKQDEAIAMLKGILDETAKASYSTSEKGNRAMLLERLGLLYRSADRNAEAVQTFREIATLNPETASRVSVHIVDTYRAAKDFARAQQESEAALKKAPGDRLLKLSHASLLADLGKTDEAAAAVRSLLNGERDRETYLALAQVYDKGKRFDEVEKALDEAEKLSEAGDERETVTFMRGAMYERAEKHELAEAEFRRIIEKNPKNAGALNYLGYMLADRGVRLDEAHELISRALEIEPNNGAYLDSLGWVYYRQNKLDEAANYLLRALESIKNDPTVHDHLGDVYMKQGRIKEAIAQWQTSLKQWESSPPADVDRSEVAKVSRKLENARVRLARESSTTAR